MRRSFTFLAVSALLASGLVAAPAAADDALETIAVVPGPSGPHLQLSLVASHDGTRLVGEMLIDAAGNVRPVDPTFRGDSTWERHRSDGKVVRVGPEGQIRILDMTDGTVTARQVDRPQPFEVGPEGVVALSSDGLRYVFTDWDGNATDLSPWDLRPYGMDRGRITAWNTAGFWVIELATGDRYTLDIPGGSIIHKNERGVSWAEEPARGSSSANWCHADWDTTVPICSTYELPAGSRTTDLVPGADSLYVVGGAQLTAFTRTARQVVAMPAGSTVQNCLGDAGALSCLLKDTYGWQLLNLSAGGHVTTHPLPDVDHHITSAHLTPTAVHGKDRRSEFWPGKAGAWRRSLVDGSEVNYAPAGNVVAKGARAVAGKQWYLDDVPGQVVDVPGIRDISGPYALTGTGQTGAHTVVDADGRTLHVPNAIIHAIFGTNVLGSRGISDFLTGEVTYDGYLGDYGSQMWGPWVSGRDFVWNRVTGQSVQLWLPSQHWGGRILLGDGVAVIVGGNGDGTFRSLVYDLSQWGRGDVLEPALDLDVRILSLDGDRVAWTRPPSSWTEVPDGAITVSRLPFGGTSAPYFLGSSRAATALSTAQPWRPLFDFSSDVAPGSLVIRDWNGKVVRTLATPASQTRIIRDVVWDTLDNSGAVVPGGPYTWELRVTDAQGRAAKASDTVSAITGTVIVGTDLVPVKPKAPVLVDACGSHADGFTVADVVGIIWHRDGKAIESGTHKVSGSTTITAVSRPGFKVSGQAEWKFAPKADDCWQPLPKIVIDDLPGAANDTFTLPALPKHAISWLVNGTEYRPGRFKAKSPGSYSVTMRMQPGHTTGGVAFGFSADGSDVPTSAPSPTMSPTPTTKPLDVYITEGEHLVNGRRWRTSCEPYSQTSRCRTEIWASTVAQEGGRFVVSNGWVFNNLTYLPMARVAWKGNPVGGNGQVEGKVEWTSPDGRQWRTECDTALTGRNGCRSYIRASQIVTVDAPGGGKRYEWQQVWVMNNMVRFSG